MSDAKEVEGKQTQAVAIEGVQYYSNKASVNELKENTTYYYQVFQNGKYQDVQKYSIKSFKIILLICRRSSDWSIFRTDKY